MTDVELIRSLAAVVMEAPPGEQWRIAAMGFATAAPETLALLDRIDAVRAHLTEARRTVHGLATAAHIDAAIRALDGVG